MKRIKSLKRAISPSHSSYQSSKKRHFHYPVTQSIEKVLVKSNSKLRFYQDRVAMTTSTETIVDELEKEGIYQRSVSGLSLQNKS